MKRQNFNVIIMIRDGLATPQIPEVNIQRVTFIQCLMVYINIQINDFVCFPQQAHGLAAETKEQCSVSDFLILTWVLWRLSPCCPLLEKASSKQLLLLTYFWAQL